MNKKLKHRYNQIENQRLKIFEQIAMLSPEHLNRKPSAGKWSISEIISHLIIAEQLSVNYIKKKIQGIEAVEDSGLWESFKVMVLTIFLRMDGLKFKAPKYVEDNTIKHQDFARLKEEWVNTRMELFRLLEKIEDKYLNRKIYKNAIVGYTNSLQALIFFQSHVAHHEHQIRRLIKKAQRIPLII